jgi:hypothetical protein
MWKFKCEGTDGTEDDDEELVKSPTDSSRGAASNISASDDVSWQFV